MTFVDHSRFPHIIDGIIAAAELEVVLVLRQTFKEIRLRCDWRVYEHVVVYPLSAHNGDHPPYNRTSVAIRYGCVISTIAVNHIITFLDGEGLQFAKVVDWYGCD
jgi:hypothetical protein